MLVGADWAVGSPALATPTLKVRVAYTANAYSLGSPDLAKPTLTTASSIKHLTANPYAVASPTSSLPALRVYQALHANAYSVGSPSIPVVPAFGQKYVLFTNAMIISAPAFGVPPLLKNYQFAKPADFSTGALDFAPALTIEINTSLKANDYTIDRPRFGFPRLTVQEIVAPWPRSYFSQADEAAKMLRTFLNYILMSLPPGQTPSRDICRRLVTTLRDHAEEAIRGTTLGTDLQAIFLAADAAGAQYAGIEAARQYLMSQSASTSSFTQVVMQNALVMTLAEECRIVARIAFPTQTEVQNMILHMRDAFEAARALGLEELDISYYQSLNALSGQMINHLPTKELQLPRFMTYSTGAPMPSLYLAQRIYADPSRSDEIEMQNGVINPCFCPRHLRVLSQPPVGLSF